MCKVTDVVGTCGEGESASRLRLSQQDRPAKPQAAGEGLRFPTSHYAGVDLLFTPSYRHHAVLEINAFGDLLPGILCDGLDTYEAELSALV